MVDDPAGMRERRLEIWLTGRNMFGLRNFLALALAFGVVAATAAPADAGSPCKQGPPAWWNAPRVSYTYSGGSSYGSNRHYQAPRRYSQQSYSPRRTYRSHSYSSYGTSTRGTSRSYSQQYYAHRRGYSDWR